MDKMVGPRRRVVTLRLPRKVFYELSEWCESRGLSLQMYLEGVACTLANQAFFLNLLPSDQELLEGGDPDG